MGEGLKIIEEFVGGIEKVWERVLGIESDSVFTQGPENSVSFVFITMVHSTQGLGLGAGVMTREGQFTGNLGTL